VTGICNCNFDINMFFKNVENSVSRILTEKEMVYHQRLEEMENKLSNLATSGPISSASDHFLLSDRTDTHTNVRNIPSTAAANISMHKSISSSCPRDRSDNVMTNLTAHFPMGVSHENAFTLSPARCTSRMLVVSYQTEAEMTSCVSEAYVGNEYAAEWSGNLKKVDNLSDNLAVGQVWTKAQHQN
jgi:hypothetical protein